ncbi:MAG: protein kinase [Fimbriimonadales bacterium]|nr:protein kinase [Fimbriimonadales bacterium]
MSSALPAGYGLKAQRFRLQRVLGQGGFAITYLAQDTMLQRLVAVKELLPDGCTRDTASLQVLPQRLTPADFQQIRQRFLQEAQLLATLRHPHIVQVYDAFEELNTAYIVMEYLQGQTLSDLMRARGGYLPEAEAVAYVLQLCEALEAVHQRGYLHRDVKPSNVICLDDGRAVLIDFGTARQFAAGKTQQHTVILTPAYAPLEQYAASAQYDARTDLYALGATLYHLATGVPPLPAPDRAQGLPLPPPNAIAPHIHQALSDAIMHALGLKPDERPPTVAAWASELRAAIAAPPAPTTPAALPNDLHTLLRHAAPNAILRLPAGIYQLNATLDITQPLTIVGEGSVQIVSCAPECALRISAPDTVALENLQFIYQGADGADLLRVEAGKAHLRQCTLQGARWDASAKVGGCGLRLLNDAQASVEETAFLQNAHSGACLSGRAQLHASRCRFEGNRYGVLVINKTYADLRECEFRQNHDGVRARDSARVDALRNRIEDNLHSGIVYADHATGFVIENHCLRNNWGVWIDETAKPQLQANHFQANRLMDCYDGRL